jgi:hypothetical protein
LLNHVPKIYLCLSMFWIDKLCSKIPPLSMNTCTGYGYGSDTWSVRQAHKQQLWVHG